MKSLAAPASAALRRLPAIPHTVLGPFTLPPRRAPAHRLFLSLILLSFLKSQETEHLELQAQQGKNKIIE